MKYTRHFFSFVLSSLMVFFLLFSYSAHAAELIDPDYALPDYRYGVTNIKAVNVREKPSAKSDKVDTLKKAGTAVLILGEEITGEDIWYYVSFGNAGKEGYVRSDLVDFIEQEEYEALKTSKSSGSASKKSSGGGSSGVTSSSSGSSSDRSDETPSSSGSVWIPTKGGKKYHKSSGCSNMDGPSNVSLDEAKSLGFTACKKCY